MKWFGGIGFGRAGQAERALCVLAFVLAAFPGSGPARGEEIGDSDLLALFAGAVVTGYVQPAASDTLTFREAFAADGTLAATAGPADDPDRHRWTGRWHATDGRLCLDVAATNSHVCRVLEWTPTAIHVRRPAGKLGAPPATPVTATLEPAGQAIVGWSLPALIVLLSRDP